MYRVSVPYAQNDLGFLFEKRSGQPREFWSLVSTIDDSTLLEYTTPGLCGRTAILTKNNSSNIELKKNIYTYTVNVNLEIYVILTCRLIDNHDKDFDQLNHVDLCCCNL